jgi:hypothetical protein
MRRRTGTVTKAASSPHERSDMRAMQEPRYRGACQRSRIRATRWLIRVTLACSQFGGDIRVVIDPDRIDALAADRAALWARVSTRRF